MRVVEGDEELRAVEVVEDERDVGGGRSRDTASIYTNARPKRLCLVCLVDASARDAR